MYAVEQSSLASELHVSGSGRNIREIDLGAVLSTKEDRALLSLITSFDLSYNCIERLHQLDPLAALTRLDASHNRIAAIGALPVTITRLDLSHNRLQSLSGIGQLPLLRELDLSHNRLRGLAGLSQAQPLQVLRVDNNHLDSSIGLEGMSRLRLISMDNNFIDSADALLFLSSTPSVEMVSLRGNPVAAVEGYRTLVAQLQSSVLSLDGAPLLRSHTTEPTRPAIAPSAQEAPKLITDADASSNSSHSVSQVLTSSAKSGSIPRSSKSHTSKPTQRITSNPTNASNSNAESCSPRYAQSTVKHNNLKPPRTASNGPSRARAMTNAQPRPRNTAPSPLPLPSPTPESAVMANAARETATVPDSAPPSESRELHEARVLIAEMRRENEYLRGRSRTVTEQLHEARRVVSSQLDELNALRQKLAAVEEQEVSLRERLDRTRRTARAVDMRNQSSATAMAIEQERLRAAYEARIADLQQQLRRQRRTPQEAQHEQQKQKQQEGDEQQQQQRRHSVDTPPSEVEIESVQVQEAEKVKRVPNRRLKGSKTVKDDPMKARGKYEERRVVARNNPPSVTDGCTAEEVSNGYATIHSNRNDVVVRRRDDPTSPESAVDNSLIDTGAETLAGELKSWLYAEMAHDACHAEEDGVLHDLRRSFERDAAVGEMEEEDNAAAAVMDRVGLHAAVMGGTVVPSRREPNARVVAERLTRACASSGFDAMSHSVPRL